MTDAALEEASTNLESQNVKFCRALYESETETIDGVIIEGFSPFYSDRNPEPVGEVVLRTVLPDIDWRRIVPYMGGAKFRAAPIETVGQILTTPSKLLDEEVDIMAAIRDSARSG
jgi:hypothetical protein